MTITFETPTIIGALCEQEREIPAQLARSMKKLAPRIAFLPFEVERRHLRNTVACMRLMDVASLLVCGRHRREIVRHLTHLDAAARRAGAVDCVIRRGKRFVGMNITDGLKSQKAVTPERRIQRKSNKAVEKHKLSQKEALGLFCQTAVEVLTQGLK